MAGDKGMYKLAQTLKILIWILLACNILAMFFVPLMVMVSPQETFNWGLESFLKLFDSSPMTKEPMDVISFSSAFLLSWVGVLLQPYTAMLAVFLWLCGICTAILIWQGKRVLDTILRGEPFCGENQGNLCRAAACCFAISGLAFIRLIWSIWFFRSINPLWTYNSLFVPIFLIAGLLCMVMSALFRQAAQMKSENDLTI